ncbi:MAG: HAMP domain-containing protein, partial [bacterium]
MLALMAFLTAPSVAPSAQHTGKLSFLVILGATLLLSLGALVFCNAMRTEALHTSLEVVRTEQLNTAAFLARELATDPATTPPATSEVIQQRYLDTLENFNSRHGIDADVIDTNSYAALTTSENPLEGSWVISNTIESSDDQAPGLTLASALTSRQRTQGFIHTTNGAELLTLVPISGATETVVMHRPVAPILEAARKLSTHFTAYLFAAFIAILIVVALFIGTLTRPLRLLTYAAQRIGKGDLDLLVQVRSTAEVGSLAEAFNTMARELRAKYRELGETTRRLEDSNRRYRDVLMEYERQNNELQLMNSLVFEANRADGVDQDRAQLTQAQRIRDSFGLQIVAFMRRNERDGWQLDHSTEPLLATCDFEGGGLIGILDHLGTAPKVRLAHPAILGESRGCSLSRGLMEGECCIVPIEVQGVIEAAFVLVAGSRPHFNRPMVERFARLSMQLGVILHKDNLLTETTQTLCWMVIFFF